MLSRFSKKFRIGEKMKNCLFISGNSIKDVWLQTILEVMNRGLEIKTEYDRKEDPPSRDATVLVEIEYPFSDPVIIRGKELIVKTKYENKYEVYGHIADLYLIESIRNGYIEEMMEGTMDHMIWESKESFPYTYHDRLFKYTPFGEEDKDKSVDPCFPMGKLSNFNFPKVAQIKHMIEKLRKSPYSRRVQGITWRPYSDPFRPDPPCLQRIWCRVIEGKLLMEATWRSRDLFKAWSANVNAMINLQRFIAYELNVEIGSYVDFSNSLHIYGKDFKELKDLLLRIYNRFGYKIEQANLIKRILQVN